MTVMLTIQSITSKQVWEKFLTQTYQGPYPFFQSWNFGEVQERMGFQVTRIGLFKNKKLIGVVSCVFIKARRGNYLHLRHGPVLSDFKEEYLDIFLTYLKKNTSLDFIRISPLIQETESVKKALKNLHFHSAAIHNMDAEICWVLDITPSEESLLQQMRKTHRYLIKKAATIGVTIESTKDPKKVEKFLKLYSGLAKRKHFIAHKGVKEELEVFGKDDQAVLLLATYQEQAIAGGLFTFVKDTAIYRHSASDENFRNIPSMYLLLWEAIREAKRRKLTQFNFWGIAPDNNPKHPWQGLTLFKTGFGGERKEYLHAQDLPLRMGYWKTVAIETLTKIRKGY